MVAPAVVAPAAAVVGGRVGVSGVVGWGGRMVVLVLVVAAGADMAPMVAAIGVAVRRAAGIQ